MRRAHSCLIGIAIVLLGTEALGRPREYTLVDLVEQAPLIIEGQVGTRLKQGAVIEVMAVIKGTTDLKDLRLNDIPRAIPDSPGLRFLPGEHVLVFLKSVDQLFTNDHQSRLNLTNSGRMVELVRLYHSAVRNNKEKGGSDAIVGLLRGIEDYDALSALERRFLVQVAGRSALKLPRPTIDQLLGLGMTDTTANVRWEAFAAARRLSLVLEMKIEFLRGLQDADRRVRAVSFDALRQKAGKTFGYDPNLPPEQQPKALADWHSWATQIK